jgi:membrane dipeptidase
MVLPPAIDLHQDLSMYYLLGPGGQGFEVAGFEKDLPNRHADIPKLKRANVRIFFGSIFPMLSAIDPRLLEQLSGGYQNEYRPFSPGGSAENVFQHIKGYYGLVDSHPENLLLIRSKEDLRRCMQDQITGILLSLEGTEGVEEVSDLRLLYNLGLRALGFTWNYDTRYAASCMSKKDFGLTGEGEALLERMNESGIIADLAHSSKRTCMDVFDLSKLPAIVSHANAKHVFDCARNVDDEVLAELRSKKGVVGFIFAKEMIGNSANLTELTKHIMYVYDNYGSEVIAIGTDFFGLADQKAPEGLEDITKFSGLWESLRSLGMKEGDLEKLAYKNALRVIETHAERWTSFV